MAPLGLVGLALLLTGMAPTVAAMLHHEVRATRAARAPGPVRDATREAALNLVGAVVASDAVVGVALVLAATGAWRDVGGWLVGGVVAVAAFYGARLLPYALASFAEVADPLTHARAHAGTAERLELELRRHRARYQPVVVRTTLVAHRAGRRVPLLWAEGGLDRLAGARPDPRLAGVADALASELGAQVRVVDDPRPLAPGLGA